MELEGVPIGCLVSVSAFEARGAKVKAVDDLARVAHRKTIGIAAAQMWLLQKTAWPSKSSKEQFGD